MPDSDDEEGGDGVSGVGGWTKVDVINGEGDREGGHGVGTLAGWGECSYSSIIQGTLT